MSPADLQAQREKIQREIAELEELERSLDPGAALSLALAQPGSGSDTDDLDDDDDDSDTSLEMEVGNGKDSSGDDDDDIESSLPNDPETCLEMNLVYQNIIQEKINEVADLIAQNKGQQAEIMLEVGVQKTTRAADGRSLPSNLFLGHFRKPYFKDKASGIGPPANEDTREKMAQGIKSFDELQVKKWKSHEKELLSSSIISDRLQRLLQPKLLKHEYLNQKLEKAKTAMDRKILEKQIKEAEREIDTTNQIPHRELLGNRLDEHDWEKISKINFDGTRNPGELRKFWQNWEHPSINKEEWSEEEIEKLKKITAKHDSQDWQTIAQELGTNRSAFQCLQKYQAYNKDFKRNEWTKEEDQMLKQLVQEMRVGRHIPYRRIAYYMEGRDSAQLIYRWTKCVDPSLRRGTWTPEEDALLLAAVKKYGERDWYKIRELVPGRNDAQCRDRYLYALHADLKKGRWSCQEEEKLIELIQKYGVGCWSKIASELPHRTPTQCLSKWKIMIGTQPRGQCKKKSRLKHGYTRRQSSSSSESESSSSSDSELELMDSSDGDAEKPQFTVPALDLWVPVRTNAAKRPAASAGSSKTNDGKGSSKQAPKASRGKEQAEASDGQGEEQASGSSAEFSTILKGMAYPYSTDISVKDPTEVVNKASESGRKVIMLSLEDVRRVIRNNTYLLRQRSQLPKKRPGGIPSMESGTWSLDLPVNEMLEALKDNSQKNRRRQKELMQRQVYDRRLLMAVTPWVGNVILPYDFGVEKQPSVQTKADVIQKRLQSVTLSSTPLFTLFIQFFQVNTNGCMKVIRERRLKQTELFRAVMTNAQKPPQVAQCLPGQEVPNKPPRKPVAAEATPDTGAVPKKKSAPPAVASTAPVPAVLEGPVQKQNLRPQRQLPLLKPKPKSVSELLQDKRLRESRAKKAVQRTMILAPQVLVPSSAILQPVIPQAPGGSKPATAMPLGDVSTPPQPAPTLGPTFLSLLVSAPPVPQSAPSSSSSQKVKKRSKRKRNEDNPGGASEEEASQDKAAKAEGPSLPQGCKKAQVLGGSSMPLVLQSQAFMPHQIAVLQSPPVTLSPAGVAAGVQNVPHSVLATSAPAPGSVQQSPVSLVPAVVTPQSSTHLVPSNLVPITWVMTPQGLIPARVQTLVGLQNQKMLSVALESQASSAERTKVAPLDLTVSQASSRPSSTPPAGSAATEVPSLPVAEGASPVIATGSSPSAHSASEPQQSLLLPAPVPDLVRSADSSTKQGAVLAALPADSSALRAAPTPVPLRDPPAGTQHAHSLCPSSPAGQAESSSCIVINTLENGSNVPVLQTDQLPSSNVPTGSASGIAALATKDVPVALEPSDTLPQLSPPRGEKSPLDYSLITLEGEASVKEWLKETPSVPVSNGSNKLPYLPPFICNLKTLSRLLLQKTTLEQNALALVSAGKSQGGDTKADLRPIQELVTTTLSKRRPSREGDGELSLTEEELAEEEICQEPATEESCQEPTEGPSNGTEGPALGGEDANLPTQDNGAGETAAVSVPEPETDVKDGLRRTRRTTRLRKRRMSPEQSLLSCVAVAAVSCTTNRHKLTTRTWGRQGGSLSRSPPGAWLESSTNRLPSRRLLQS
ncbi:snRNA-activating protein complex subunit 4 isoform A [Alligator mississippiensis]|uniref:snRNA-activating protein complex subunit 4 isoform A n=1 Tax=Alligator mississippiensis TaxID=8496 RepID=A0A151MFX2_ALLMI|nr:snRNA-activating protein complex subunit 4 isoform A [Alligator mississippiensis]